METQRDIQGADPGRVRLPLLRAIDPVGSKGRSRPAVGRKMTGGSCISESSTEQSGEGGFLRGRPGAGETVRRLLWCPEQGTDAREWVGWTPWALPLSFCLAPPALSTQLPAPGGRASSLAWELRAPGLCLLPHLHFV